MKTGVLDLDFHISAILLRSAAYISSFVVVMGFLAKVTKARPVKAVITVRVTKVFFTPAVDIERRAGIGVPLPCSGLA